MLRIYLFGQFGVEYQGRIMAGFESSRVQELFCYLLLNRHHRCSRDSLATLFWGDCTTTQSRKNLRQTLWHLRTALKTDTADTGLNIEDILGSNADWVQVKLNADCWMDVDFFERVWNKIKHAQGKDLDAASVQEVRSAVALHKSSLLDGNYADWCLHERDRLLNICIAMLVKLMEYSETHCEYEACLAYGARILSFDCAHESTHRWLMRLYYLLGDRAAALKQYQHCETALRDELFAQPDRQTQALYRRILADRQNVASPIDVEAEAALLLDVLGDLKQIQIVQSNLLHQVQHDIQLIEETLSTEHYTHGQNSSISISSSD
jgi:DNA-binding SARP family transcriptional activator